MKVKKLIALLLSLIMLLGAFSLLAVPASAADVNKSTYYYYEDFEDLPVGTDTDKIAAALGWDDWDKSVAELEIVETIYMRELSNDPNCSALLTEPNKAALKTALYMTEEEWTQCPNLKTVDVAAIKSVEGFEGIDFTGYASYNKKLLIKPKTANTSASVVLTDKVDLSGTEVLVDYELIPNYANTIDRTFGSGDKRTYDSDSSVGIKLSNDATGASVTQALMVNSALRFTYNDSTVGTQTGDIPSKNWYANSLTLNNLYQSGISLDYSSSTYRTYADGTSGCLFLGKTNRLNGYRFSYRMKFSANDLVSYTGYSPNTFDVDKSYLKDDAANNKGITWATGADLTTISTVKNTDCIKNAKKLMTGTAGQTGTASLCINKAGVAYYLDNVAVYNRSTTAATATNTAYTYYYHEDFEDIPVSATSQEIATALGWTNWDHTVAELRIVETIYKREFANDSTYSPLISSNESSLQTALGMASDWSTSNLKTVDVAAIKSIDAFKDADFSGYKSLNKKLLIIPKTANGDTSVVLSNNVNLGAENIFVDYELTPNFLYTIDNNKITNNTAVSFDSDSSVGITLSNASGASVKQELMVNASFRYTYTNGDTTASSDIKSAAWFKNSVAYQSDNNELDYVASSRYRTYNNGASGCLFLGGTRNLNGYRFAYRMKFGNDFFETYVGNPVKSTDLDYSYLINENDTAKNLNAWYTLSPTDSFKGGAKALMDGSVGSVSLSVNNAGVAYYLDNIAVADHNGKVNNTTLSTAATITVNGEQKTVLKDAVIEMGSLIPTGKTFVYAVAYNTIFTNKNNTIKLRDGLDITAKGVGFEMTPGASMRPDTFAGLRWQTLVNKADFDDLYNDSLISDIVVGTIITTADNLGEKDWNQLTDDEDCLKLESSGSALYNPESEDSRYSYCGSLVNIKETNRSKAFVGRGYMTMKVGSTTITIYSNYEGKDTAKRDVITVAQKALADVKTEGTGDYQYRLAEGDMYLVETSEGVYEEKYVTNEAVYSVYSDSMREKIASFFQ